MTTAVAHTPIRTNPNTRESRLFPSMWAYVRRQHGVDLPDLRLYEPLRIFTAAAAVVGLAALVLWGRFLYLLIFEGHGSGHLQSLILGAVLFIAAIQLMALGVVGDILAASRLIQQRTLERVRRVELQLGVEPSHYEPGAEGSERRRTTGAEAGPRDRQDRGAGGFEAVSTQAPEAVPTGNTFDKYGSTNPVVRRLMTNFHRQLDELWGGRARNRCSTWGAARACSPTSGREAGRPSHRRHRPPRSELQSEWSSRERPNLEFRAEEATSLSFGDDEFDMACAIEVLEHVPDPRQTLSEMARVARRWLLVSVPREPLWRVLNMARGAYLRDLGNTPGT